MTTFAETSASTTTARGPGLPAEVCRVTVAGPGRRADLAVPVSATIGELLPLVLRYTADDTEREAAWVLQRLGGPPLDPGATPESLDLHDGEVLYLSREDAVLPEIHFDDLGVGVARAVGARGDQWRPGFTRRLLLGLAGVPLAAFAVATLGVSPHSLQMLYLGVVTVSLAVAAVLVTRLLHDRGVGLLTGLSACGFAAVAGLAARHGTPGVFGPDRYDLQLAAACVTFVASVVPAACRLPIEPFGVIVGTGFAATVGAALGAGFGWDATTSATVLAVAVFVTTMSLRFVLRAAQLRVPQLPRTAEELQQDIDPEPEASVVRRTAAAVTYLNSLYITASLVFVAAFALLASSPEWACWTLALVFSAAVLLRARSLTVAWQRVPLAASGAMGLALVLDFRIGHASVSARGFALLALAVAATAILTAAGRPPARLLPIWGHIADLLETWTAIAIVPLLLQMLHAYARFRALIG